MAPEFPVITQQHGLHLDEQTSTAMGAIDVLLSEHLKQETVIKLYKQGTT